MSDKEFCCEHFQFMWDNHLLEERSTTEYFREDGTDIFITFIKGYRLRRSFWCFKRDQVFYKCPFCNVELIFATGVEIPERYVKHHVVLKKIGSTSIKSPFKIPMSVLKEALFTTKIRCKSWPPKD